MASATGRFLLRNPRMGLLCEGHVTFLARPVIREPSPDHPPQRHRSLCQETAESLFLQVGRVATLAQDALDKGQNRRWAAFLVS